MYQYMKGWYDWYYYIILTCDYCGKKFKREKGLKPREYSCCSTNCCLNLMSRQELQERASRKRDKKDED